MALYSHSQLSTFETCPLQYRFIYVDKIRREEEGVEAFVGLRFHEAMEKLYRELAFRVMPLDELLGCYEELWAKEFHADIIIKREGKTADDYRKLGRRFIEDYYKRHHPFDKGRVIGLEKRVQFFLDKERRCGIKGVVDRVSRAADGTFEVHDYKTSSALPEQRELDEDRQLALYQMGVQEMWPEAREVKLIWHYVAFDAEMSSVRTTEALEELKMDTMRLIARIEATREFEAQESVLCDWCAYQDMCPKKKHIVRVNVLPVNEYLNEPGVKIVNAYAGLAEKRGALEAEVKAVEAELEKVKEAAIVYAERERVEVIKGSGHLLRVTAKERISSPPKDSEERAELQEMLKTEGVWEEVADLDPFALARAMKEARWPAKLVERIKRFLSFRKEYAVRLSKDREREEE